MSSICILMSTYNGDLFLRDQLDSLYQQAYSNIVILVRDDGSADSTIQILKDYSEHFHNLHYYEGKNLKPARSFLDLIEHAPKADYYAFCDQDDIWMEDKLSSAISKLHDNNADLYYSSYTTADRVMKVLEKDIQKPIMTTLGQAMVFASVTGCTMVFTERLLEFAKMYSPQKIMMHDSWLFKVALALDFKIVYDKQAHILYRQHDNNVIGNHQSLLKKWKNRMRRLLSNTKRRYYEIEELYIGYSNIMSEKQLAYLEPMIGYYNKNLWKRFCIAFNPAYRTHILSKDFLFIIAVLLKKY